MNTNPLLRRNVTAERAASLSRRHFLRGLGACFALPAFESLRPLKVMAEETSAKAAPVRMAFRLCAERHHSRGVVARRDRRSNFDLPRTLQRWKSPAPVCSSFPVWAM